MKSRSWLGKFVRDSDIISRAAGLIMGLSGTSDMPKKPDIDEPVRQQIVEKSGKDRRPPELPPDIPELNPRQSENK